ncbi:MAG: hypothetical protein IPK52_21845 [Chloroflexi bacterium]|nr:hypothetical protein [Chloroflexota bacterium]
MNIPAERPPSDFLLPDDAFADIFVLDQASLAEAAAVAIRAVSGRRACVT